MLLFEGRDGRVMVCEYGLRECFGFPVYLPRVLAFNDSHSDPSQKGVLINYQSQVNENQKSRRHPSGAFEGSNYIDGLVLGA